MKNGTVIKKSLNKRKKLKPKYKTGVINRIAEKINPFSKSDTTCWFHKFLTTTEVTDDTLPTQNLNNLLEK